MNRKEWAQLGAARRVEEISAELAEIAKAFPDLRGGSPCGDGQWWRHAAARGRAQEASSSCADVSRSEASRVGQDEEVLGRSKEVDMESMEFRRATPADAEATLQFWRE